ncbi:MAG TPA: hypothetical protein VHY58_23145 [Streptosporangiaceae bacterium]|nr:hypothetical protein [Streptosporangiaceae bacterium]
MPAVLSAPTDSPSGGLPRTVAHSDGGTNYTAISITLGIFIVGAVISNQAEVRDQLAKLTEHVGAVEQFMRDVG